ncbi:MAG: arginyltransferase [Pseudomonadota bacterium]
MSAPTRFPRFFVTHPSPCPYLPGRTERKVFTELSGEHASELNDALSRIGFRRSQNVAYRPSCMDCKACVSVRVVAEEFAPSRTQRRIARANGDLVARVCRPWATEEQYSLLKSYLAVRHPDGGMVDMDESDYADMVEQSPVRSHIIEYREPADEHGQEGRLVGACLTDVQGDGLSMVYSFFDPNHPTRQGLGNYIILEHIERARREHLPYVYLGYWVNGSPRMAYKTRYKPLERLGPNGWYRADIDASATMPASAADSTPDGA